MPLLQENNSALDATTIKTTKITINLDLIDTAILTMEKIQKHFVSTYSTHNNIANYLLFPTT